MSPSPWYRELNRYHWLVLVVASLGWLCDCMDQQLFNLARRPAMLELLHVRPGDASMAGPVAEYAGYATMIFMIGWASGGVLFGILGDRIGRVKTMVLSILFYSAFTGLSVLSTGVWDFSAYRFLTGLGVGGEFAVGVALVAEVMPDRARPFALGWLQACSALGNVIAALIGIGLGQLQQAHIISSSWRMMFVIGALPALLVVIIMRRLQEPEAWQRAKADKAAHKAQLGSMAELFSDRRWRRSTLVGMSLAFAGVVGLWGIGFFSFDLLSSVLGKTFRAQGLPETVIAGKTTMWTGITSLLQNFGAFWGVYAFTHYTHHVGRRKAFAFGFIAAMISTAFTFWRLKDFSDIFWMIPIMGFFQIGLFGGYAIYFPELFPTRLRSTGTSFCYNVGRLVAAVGPLSLGLLTSGVYGGYDEPMRYAGMTMCLVFLFGIAVLPWAPETRGRPLPE
ncbi:MAG: MFS transporter [Acidobacteria bacterium]|jgi:MFS family permease|nr:MAG: MFS transporter [Acidobacteriota bacterium]